MRSLIWAESVFIIHGIVFAGVASAASYLHETITPTNAANSTRSVEPCALVSSTIAAQESQPTQLVPAKLAYECLTSVPVDIDGDIQEIEDLKLYIEWQSDLAYQKNPPAGSLVEAIDVFGNLDVIKSNLRLGTYLNEYDVQRDITTAIRLAHNGHFAYATDIYYGVFSFVRSPDAILASVSADGIQLPKVYTYADLTRAAENASFTASEVIGINGYDATSYLSQLSSRISRTDKDSRYNAVFPNQAVQSIDGSATDSFGIFFSAEYDGPETVLQFANGTQVSFPNYAIPAANFSEVDSGKAFFEKFCTGHIPSATTSAAASTTLPPAISTASGYPYPFLIHSKGVMSGYFLNGTGYDDVAVLSIPTFLMPCFTNYITPGDNTICQQEFQMDVQWFLGNATAKGKKKLIIDVRGNPGGDGVLAEDLFKQLFPSQAPYIGMRVPRINATEQMSLYIANYVEDKLRHSGNVTGFEYDRLLLGLLDYTVYVDSDYKPFASVNDMWNTQQDFWGSHFTHVLRENFSDPNSYGYLGFSVTGYLNRTHDVFPQPFASEDILLLQDGTCGSTCSFLAEMLRTQGNVSTLAIGGLPHAGPVPSYGGVRGALQLGAYNIQSYAQAIYNLIPQEQHDQYSKSAFGRLASGGQAFNRATKDPETGAPVISVNGKDLLRMGDEEQVPVQWKFDMAQGRLFYTPEMMLNVTKTWEGVVDAWWGGSGLVQDSRISGKDSSGQSVADYVHDVLQTRDEPHSGVKRDGGSSASSVVVATITTTATKSCNDFGLGTFCSDDSATTTTANLTGIETCNDFGLGTYCSGDATTTSMTSTSTATGSCHDYGVAKYCSAGIGKLEILPTALIILLFGIGLGWHSL